MYFRVAIAFAMLFFISPVAVSQAVAHAECGNDGKAHVTYENGTTKIVAPEPKQVGCENIFLADNRHTVGWSVLTENCCTSYPIATRVVVYRDGRKTVIPSDQMVWQWRFIGQGEQIALLSGPVHGWANAAQLRDSRTAKVLASWNGIGSAPKWAEGWAREFEAEENKK